MGRFAKGYHRDLPHRRTQKDYAAEFVKLPAAPAEASLEAHEYKPILDQNRGGSCGGHGTAQLLYVAFAAEGSPLLWCPSPGYIYGVTRQIARADALAPGQPLDVVANPLTDSGVMPSDLVRALAAWGIKPMLAPSPEGFNTDVDLSNIDDEPQLGSLETGLGNIVTGEYRIDETSPTVIDQMCVALAFGGSKGTGIPVGIGAFVDTMFEDWDPSQPPPSVVNLGDPQGGGHWFAATSYFTESSTGKRVFRGPNSWSDSWGDQGHWEVTEDWILAAATDIYPWAVSRAA